MRVIIFGAQGIALGTYNAIQVVHPDWEVLCFMVTSLEGNPASLRGESVKTTQEVCDTLSMDELKSVSILICTPESVMDSVEEGLLERGFSNITRMDSVSWARLQEDAFAISQQFKPLSCYEKGMVMPSARVFMAKFWKDKELKSAAKLDDYFLPIQAGAINTEVRVADMVDCDGDNISSKNPNYSELTALYWVWKHALAEDGETSKEYYGLAHYRRFLMVSQEELLRIKGNDIDAVFPYPMPYEPNIEEHHKRYLSDSEWSAVLQALSELHPEEYDGYMEVLKQGYMFNYNIVLAKKDVLKAYCEWLFPILFRVEEIHDPDGGNKPNRYIGYIAETLETIYFMCHKDKLKIAHAGCRFLT